MQRQQTYATAARPAKKTAVRKAAPRPSQASELRLLREELAQHKAELAADRAHRAAKKAKREDRARQEFAANIVKASHARVAAPAPAPPVAPPQQGKLKRFWHYIRKPLGNAVVGIAKQELKANHPKAFGAVDELHKAVKAEGGGKRRRRRGRMPCRGGGHTSYDSLTPLQKQQGWRHFSDVKL